MKRCMRYALVVFLVLMLPLAAPAKDITIAFSFIALESDFWMAAYQGIMEEFNRRGVKVIEMNADEDANRQYEQVMDAITQGVDGVFIIPQDGEIAVTIGYECNDAGIPYAVYNRPPHSKDAKALVVVADNQSIAEKSVEYMVEEARKLGEKVTPAIMVGDLGDPNAVARRKGFHAVIEKYPDLFNEAIEIPTKWDANVARANLQSAFQANPEINFLFTSSDFLLPTIKGVLEPLGKWKKPGEEGRIILGSLDGAANACEMMKEGYVAATGVQDVFGEATMLLDALMQAIENGEETPDEWLYDPGFALTQANFAEREMDMWGCRLLANQ